MKEQILALAKKIENKEIADKEIPFEFMKIIEIEKNDNQIKTTLNDFIFDCLKISSKKRKLPVKIIAPNNIEFYPEIKIGYKNDIFFDGEADRVFITF